MKNFIIKKSNPNDELKIIREAFEFAKKVHRGEKRKTGEDFIIHPLSVANILKELRLDQKTIAAGILHDVIENTSVTTDDIEKKFGKEIAQLVRGVTKLDKITFEGNLEEYSIENLRRMFLAMSEDIRVVLIKLADRLHNMRSLAIKSHQDQRRIARETIEIYAPVAERLCMSEFKGTLEDLAFPYLYPEEYKWIKDHMTKAYKERHRITKKMQKVLKKELFQKEVRLLNIHGRAKHLYSLYRKLLRYDMDVTRIYDLVALRVVVENIEECYKTLGVIHSRWKPLQGRIRDYIATPKSNGYRSLHTTIISNIEDEIVEVQIRTPKMHAEAEYGIAAHWHYDYKGSTAEKMTSGTWRWFTAFKRMSRGKASFENLPWIKQIKTLETKIEKPKDFLKNLQSEFLKDRIVVLTPKGDVRNLPAGSTPIDFAFTIHTDIGYSCIGAKINNKLVPLNTKIQSGDIVKIITSKIQNGPRQKWLNFAVTSNAKNKIQEWFRQTGQNENMRYGKNTLENVLESRKKISLRKIPKDRIKSILKKLSYETIDDMFGAIGRGEITAHQIVDLIFRHKEGKELEEKIEISPTGENFAIIADKKIPINIASCCSPKEGNPIKSILHKNIINVHKSTCPNLEKNNLVLIPNIQWISDQAKQKQNVIALESYGRTGLLRDIASTFADKNIGIISFVIKHKQLHNPRLTAAITIETTSDENLEEALRKVRKIKGVVKANKKV
ncbi:MAG: hypothetical protein ACD_63C00213G0003 [uncultured bacterium]|nr:MAG: hypothetical protein ACD_63C00213G0003 [uncultured bacterium]